MKTEIEGKIDYYLELWMGEPKSKGAPVHSQCVTSDLADLAEECFMRGILSESLPLEYSAMRVQSRPVWTAQPFVQEIEMTVAVETSHGPRSYTQRFGAGRWARTAQRILPVLIQEGILQESAQVYRALVGLPHGQVPAVETPPLEPPNVVSQSLEDYGVQRLGPGMLDPQRPVLINTRMAADIVQCTEQAGTNEAGGAVLGKIIRLAEALPGTTTRIVTILAAGLADERHVGGPATFRFSPEALAAAAQIAQVRGKGESVLTAWHSHGWSDKCIDCRKETCPMPSAEHVSGEDYQVLESLFSSKATLMPIAGRKTGVPLKRPAVVVHNWRGGLMRPIEWREYED
jgi:hypothetical protein